jgi:hypothetical protein
MITAIWVLLITGTTLIALNELVTELREAAARRRGRTDHRHHLAWLTARVSLTRRARGRAPSASREE